MNNSPETITCPVCGKSNCYVDKQEIEDDKLIKQLNLNEGIIKSYLCKNCGYTSSSVLKKDSDIVKNLRKSWPKMIIDLEFYDSKRDINWYLAVIQNDNGRIFPEPDENDWHWTYTPMVKIKEEEKELFKTQDENNKDVYYKYRIADEQAIKYDKSEFSKALVKIGLAKEE